MQLLLMAASTSTGIILDHRFIIIFINRTFIIKESVAHRFTFSLIITSSLTGDKETHQFTFPIKRTSSINRDNRPQWLTFSKNNFFTRRLMTFTSKEITTHLPRWNQLTFYLHKENVLIQPKITQTSTIVKQGSLRFIVDFNCSYSSSWIPNNHEPNDKAKSSTIPIFTFFTFTLLKVHQLHLHSWNHLLLHIITTWYPNNSSHLHNNYIFNLHLSMLGKVNFLYLLWCPVQHPTSDHCWADTTTIGITVISDSESFWHFQNQPSTFSQRNKYSRI